MSDSKQHEPPSTLGAFFRGFLTSSASSLAIMGLVFLLTKTLAWAGALAAAPAAAPFFVTAAIASAAVGIFSGVMRVVETRTAPAPHKTYTPLPVQGLDGPVIVPNVTPELAPEAPTRNWTEAVGRQGDAKNRVQEILSNGSMNDKDRATALLAARETQSTEAARA